MKLLLDTSAYVGFMRGDQAVVDYLIRASSIFVSPIVLGELMYGFLAGTRFGQNMQELDSFLNHPAVEKIHLTDITADRYSRIATQLKKQGTPIPANDIWIASQTLETGAELVTLDRHFENIHGLVYRLFTPPDK